MDYKKEDFETKLSDYDLVLHSQDGTALEKSLRVLRPGGRLVSISGPPDPEFAEGIGAPWFVKLVMWALSFGARRKAKSLNTKYSVSLHEGKRRPAATGLLRSDRCWVVRPVRGQGLSVPVDE